MPSYRVESYPFEVMSPEALRDAAHDAALAYERIVEAVESGSPAEPKEGT
jgi:hypothetical protein